MGPNQTSETAQSGAKSDKHTQLALLIRSGSNVNLSANRFGGWQISIGLCSPMTGTK